MILNGIIIRFFVVWALRLSPPGSCCKSSLRCGLSATIPNASALGCTHVKSTSFGTKLARKRVLFVFFFKCGNYSVYGFKVGGRKFPHFFCQFLIIFSERVYFGFNGFAAVDKIFHRNAQCLCDFDGNISSWHRTVFLKIIA